MQITMNIEAAQVGDTIVATFNNLTQEQKLEIAKQVMLEWLKEPWDLERQSYEREVFRRLRADTGFRSNSGKTDDQLRQDYDYSNKMREFMSTREKMINTITTEVANHYRACVAEIIKNDPQIQEAKGIVLEAVKKIFPAAIHNALVKFFSDQMGAISDAAASACMFTADNVAKSDPNDPDGNCVRDGIKNRFQSLYSQILIK